MKIILDEKEIDKAIARLSHEIIEKNRNIGNIALVGIKNRGDILAKRTAAEIEKINGKKVLSGALDISFYRDDYSIKGPNIVPGTTDISFDISGKTVIIIDDVLYTGRSIRAAMDELMDFGRPRAIQLAVLIDRGHKELPISADYVGKNVPTSENENIEVKLKETDGENAVYIKYS